MATLFQLPKAVPIQADGRPYALAKAYFYLTATNTPASVYTTAALNVAHSQPVQADSDGVFPAIYLDPAVTYKLTLNTAADALIYSVDPVSDTLTANSIGVLLFSRTAAEIAGGVTPTNYAYPPGDARRYGVVGDGVALDTLAMQAAIDGAASGGTVVVPGGFNCKIGQIHIAKNLIFVADGATFTLVGDYAGFLVDGAITYFRVYGGAYNGDGTNRDSAPLTAQAAWVFGNTSGAQVSNVKVFGSHASNVNVGFKAADGRGGGGTKTTNVQFVGCSVTTAVGQVGGVGYGFQFAQADGSGCVGCRVENAERHSFYLSEGKDYTLAGCISIGGGFGSARGGFSVSRSANVAISSCVAVDRNDYGLIIDTDAQGLAPDNVLNGVTVSSFTSSNNTLGSIKIGTNSPSTDGAPANVTIEGATLVTKSGSTNSDIVVSAVNGLVMRGINIDSSGAGANQRSIAFTAAGGATYTIDVSVDIDRIKTTGTGFGIQVESALQTSTNYIRLAIKQLTGGGAQYDFVGGEDNTTNPNLYYRRVNGSSSRTYTSSGSSITVPVGGLTAMIFSASSATTVSQLSGGSEGDELTLFFTNGNTTIKATNIYTPGAVDFVGTAADCLRLIYLSGAWRAAAAAGVN